MSASLLTSRWRRSALNRLRCISAHAQEAGGKMAAATSVPHLDHLPSDPLLHILSFLSFRDLIKYDFYKEFIFIKLRIKELHALY